MDQGSALDLYTRLVAAGVRTWVIGGWGVDALLGAETREHKDLDVLVRVVDLPLLAKTLALLGFERAYEWAENRPVTLAEGVFDTAYVATDGTGRMLDVHAWKWTRTACHGGHLRGTWHSRLGRCRRWGIWPGSGFRAPRPRLR